MVDEYQDTNTVQFQLSICWQESIGICAWWGDDDQSI